MGSRIDSRRIKKIFFVVIINLAPILFVLFFIDSYLQKYKGFQPYVRPSPGQFPNGKIPIWAQSDSRLGWVANQTWAPHQINRQGFRDTKDFDSVDSTSAPKRIMFLGDSFIFGFLLKSEETAISYLQKKLGTGYEIYNLGMNGYGIDQMYLAYQQYKDKINPNIVILCFIDDDATRVLDGYRFVEQMNKPCFTIEDGDIVPRTSKPKGSFDDGCLLCKSITISYVKREICLFAEAKPIIQKIFLNIAHEVERKKGKFFIIRIPTPDNFDALERLRRGLNNFEGMIDGTEARYFEPVEEIKKLPNWKVEYYFSDGHINAKGNQFLADYIYQHVIEK